MLVFLVLHSRVRGTLGPPSTSGTHQHFWHSRLSLAIIGTHRWCSSALIVTHPHLSALICTHHHSSPLLALISTHRHSSALIDTHRHSLALIGTHRHSLALIGNKRHSYALIGTHRHSSALIGPPGASCIPSTLGVRVCDLNHRVYLAKRVKIFNKSETESKYE